MVGDSSTDIHTARAARVPVIAVDFGYTEVPIASLQPDRIISAFRRTAGGNGGLSWRSDPSSPPRVAINVNGRVLSSAMMHRQCLYPKYL